MKNIITIKKTELDISYFHNSHHGCRWKLGRVLKIEIDSRGNIIKIIVFPVPISIPTEHIDDN